MADNQGTYVMKLAVDGNDNIRVAINGLTEGYQTLSRAVSMANDKLRDQKTAHKGTANFYKQEISNLENLRDRLAKTAFETSKYNKAIDDLAKKKAALSAPAKGTLEAYRQEIKELRNLQATVAKTPASYDSYEKKIAGVKINVEKLTRSQRMQIKTNKDMISNAGLGGATLTELGRTVSDSNYGFTAMANNLSQLSTLFITFVSKTEGGLMPALKGLGKQLIGPLGIVLALQVVIALFEKFSMSQKQAESDINKTTEALSGAKGQIAQLEKHAKVLNDSTANAKAQEYALKQLKEDGYDPLIGSLEEFLEAKKAILLFDVREEQMRGKIKEALEKELELQEELKEADEDRVKRDKNIQKSTTRNAEQKSRDLVTSAEKFKKESDKIAGEIDVVRREVDDLLNLSAKAIETMGLEMGENPFFNTIIGSGTGDELSKLDDLLKQWYEKRVEAETESELELLNLKEQFAIKEATQLGATKDQLLDIERYFQIERYKLEKEGLERVEKAKKGAIVDASIERKTDLQLWAEKELNAQKAGWKKELKALGAALKKRQKLKEKANEIEAKIAKQREDFLIDAAIGTLFASFDLMDAEYQKQITLEQNKTNALNNELKLRLQNENLSKNERQKIQNQIAQNDEKLRIKQEEIERKRFKLNKAAQISNALINTASMVLKAADLFKFPSPAGIAAIALSSALGAVQVAAISKQKFQTSAMSNPAISNSGASGGTVQAPDFNIVGASQTNQIAEAIQSRLEKPVRAYVVSKDVSTAQEMDRNIVSTATL